MRKLAKNKKHCHNIGISIYSERYFTVKALETDQSSKAYCPSRLVEVY